MRLLAVTITITLFTFNALFAFNTLTLFNRRHLFDHPRWLDPGYSRVWIGFECYARRKDEIACLDIDIKASGLA